MTDTHTNEAAGFGRRVVRTLLGKFFNPLGDLAHEALKKAEAHETTGEAAPPQESGGAATQDPPQVKP